VDKAHYYLVKALELAPKEAATHEAMARLWRDAGMPHLALGDAYRAVHYDPVSAPARNTLGTVFQALGRPLDGDLSIRTGS
jgi:Tfp pilus assembly protein PilF